jgi:hypothetical protein
MANKIGAKSEKARLENRGSNVGNQVLCKNYGCEFPNEAVAKM